MELPKGAVERKMREVLAEHSGKIRLQADARDFVSKCASKFVKEMATEAQKVCDEDKKKTILPKHIFLALKNLGFSHHLTEVQSYCDEVKKEHEERNKIKRKRKKELQNIDKEDLIAEQQRLLQKARKENEAFLDLNETDNIKEDNDDENMFDFDIGEVEKPKQSIFFGGK